MKKISILIAGFLLAFAPVKADEGMWLPMFVKRLNYVDMQKQGLQLTPEEIYSVNNSSLKDAIVRLGRGFCTGEIISDQGLMLTNHHCGFGVIQENSTEEHNYLDDGFWAMKKEDELPAGFAVSFLVRMEDVSKSVNDLLNEDMSLADRAKAIRKVSDSLEKAAVGESEYTANVKSFYDGNEFYLFVYETFPDVRLVGAPPSSVGKFGGDTDNWMWPRHTGDFTMFRVYADKDNKPAEYSKDNKPYTPKHSLPISLKGVEPGDFSMIFGYPGSTDRYLTSEGINYELEVRQPASVKLRRQVLDMYQAGMDMNEKTRIQYASKFASVANYWKYFIGQQAGLKRLKVYDKKKAQEDALAAWIAKDEDRKKLYAGVIEGFKTGYDSMKEANRVRVYLNEAIFRVEAIAYSFQFSGLKSALESENETSTKQTVERIQGGIEGHFKDYNMEIDRNVFAAMMKAYSEDIPKENQPEDFKKMISKYKGDFQKMANVMYDKSIFGSKEKVEAFLKKPSAKVLDKDPIFMIQSSIIGHYRSTINPIVAAGNEGLQRSKRLFIKGLREMNSDKVYAADANSTVCFVEVTSLKMEQHTATLQRHKEFWKKKIHQILNLLFLPS